DHVASPFFSQPEAGIRLFHVTGVQTCPLPICIAGLVRRYLRDPRRIELSRAESLDGDAASITQTAYVVPRGHKPAALGRVLDIETPGATVVFCRTREEIDRLTETMNGRGYRAEALHG